VAGAAALVLVVTQIALPPYLEHRVADRLEAHGGEAKVDLDAVPALRLLAQDGHSLDVRGHGLGIDLEELDPNAKLFDRLDGFDRARIDLTDVTAGPFSVASFTLSRPESASQYGLAMRGSTSARRLSDYAASRLSGLLGALLSGTSETLGLGARPIPFDVAARLESDGGRARVVSSRGRIAGLDAGPFTQLLVNAVASRL
jgi:hypothetical protein